jgi:hypothetical protein
MSEETNKEVEHIGDLVSYLALFTSQVEVEVDPLLRKEDCVLRYWGVDIPPRFETVRLPHLGKSPVYHNREFCPNDGIKTVTLYEEGEISIDEGICDLESFIWEHMG